MLGLGWMKLTNGNNREMLKCMQRKKLTKCHWVFSTCDFGTYDNE